MSDDPEDRRGDEGSALGLLSDQTILSLRLPKNSVDPWKPYAYLVEPERAANGVVEDVATLFLTNKECPFRCLMCDLWKNTLDHRVPLGAIPAQIEFALQRLPSAQHLKLYNSANFFDSQAIPFEDWPEIAAHIQSFKTVIVENHPRMCGENCLRFRDLLRPQLEVAIGLETIEPETLKRLNKRMTLDDFARAVDFLHAHQIAVRAFLLLRPPFQSEAKGLDWACRGIDYAHRLGIGCVSVIPVRGGNGIMEQLHQQGDYRPPELSSVERVLEYGLRQSSSRVFVDLWDLGRPDPCSRCGPRRRERIARMNLSQIVEPPITCDCK